MMESDFYISGQRIRLENWKMGKPENWKIVILEYCLPVVEPVETTAHCLLQSALFALPFALCPLQFQPLKP